jgi:hypothetical protein
MGVFFVSEKQLGLCVFTYDGEDAEYDQTLEDRLGEIADYLRGWKWNPDQWADLVVIGETGEHHYILNHPSNAALENLAAEYGGKGRCPKEKDVNRTRLYRVTVRNTKISGHDSIILEAFVQFAKSAHGYCTIFPTYMNVGLQELDALIEVMMELKMLKLNRSKGLQWIRQVYKKLNAAKKG